MKRNIFYFATMLSSVLLLLTMVLFFVSYKIEAHKHSLSITDNFHISTRGHSYGTHIVFFSDKRGPYQGSIISLYDSSKNPVYRKIGFGYFLGIYYRYFSWSDTGVPHWTLMLIIWYPFVIFGILPAIWLRRKFRPKKHKDKENQQPAEGLDRAPAMR